MYVVFGHFSGIVSQSVIWRIRTFEIECQILVFPHMFTPFFLTKKKVIKYLRGLNLKTL